MRMSYALSSKCVENEWLCSHLAMQGAPGKAIQVLAGHQEISVTRGYMHLSPDVLGSSIQLLDTRPRLVKRGDIVETASAQHGS